MTKIKIASLRSFFDDGKGLSIDKKYSVGEEQVTAYVHEGWATEWPAGSDGTVRTDGGDGDDGDTADDLADGRGGDEGPDGIDAGGV